MKSFLKKIRIPLHGRQYLTLLAVPHHTRQNYLYLLLLWLVGKMAPLAENKKENVWLSYENYK